MTIFDDIQRGETLVPISKASRLFRQLIPPSRTTVWRMVKVGTTSRGVKIRLEAARTSAGLATTKSSVRRYLGRMASTVAIEQETVERIRPRALVHRTRGSDERLEKLGF